MFCGITVLLLVLGGCVAFVTRPLPDEAPIVTVWYEKAECWAQKARVLFRWSAEDDYTFASQMLYRTRLVTQDLEPSWPHEWTGATSKDCFGIPDGVSRFEVQARDSNNNIGEGSCFIEIKCKLNATPNVCVYSSPDLVVLPPDGTTFVSFTFTERAGWCNLVLTEYVDYYELPDGREFRGIPEHLSSSIVIPAQSTTVWTSQVQLPSSIVEELAYDIVILRRIFTGEDCSGSQSTVEATLLVQVDRPLNSDTKFWNLSDLPGL